MQTKFHWSGKEIDLTSENMSIKSDNFNVDKNGNVVISNPNPNREESESTTLRIKMNENTYTDYSPGLIRSFEDGEEQFRLMAFVPLMFLRRINSNGQASGTTIWHDHTVIQDENGITTTIWGDGISAPLIHQKASTDNKKNIKKTNIKALDIIENADICSYIPNNNSGLTRYGLIVAEGYNCPEEVKSLNKEVEQGSMTALAWKAIQELTPKDLYNNTSGSTGTITLSESTANFDYIEIFYGKNQSTLHSVKVANPNGKRACLTLAFYDTSNQFVQMQAPKAIISGTTITKEATGGANIYSGNTEAFTANEVSIFKVVGYK